MGAGEQGQLHFHSFVAHLYEIFFLCLRGRESFRLPVHFLKARKWARLTLGTPHRTPSGHLGHHLLSAMVYVKRKLESGAGAGIQTQVLWGGISVA